VIAISQAGIADAPVPALLHVVLARSCPSRHANQALNLLRLSLSAERELLALNAQVASLEAELSDLQERHGRSVSSALREMFSKAAGGQGVVDALTNGTKDGALEADSVTATATIAAPDQQPSRSWWSWGRS